MKVPGFIRPIFWSAKIDSLHLKKDRNYIIHQILAYGDLKAIKWLFKNYSKKQITDSFKKSFKDYRKQRFYFIKNIILELENWQNDERLYVKDTPRIIR